MKKLTTLVSMVLALSLALAATPVHAVPALPHAFYGGVLINGSPAPPGTRVEARGAGVTTGVEGNPVVTTASGIYGTSSPFAPRLIVQGEIEEGATLTFYVNGRSTDQTAEWHTGETNELDLTVTIVAPPPPPPAEAVEVVPGYWDVSEAISYAGVFTADVTLESADDVVQVTIAEDTIGLTAEGEPLEVITVVAMAAPPPPPAEAEAIGLTYDFGPEGATFEPPITITFTFVPAELPEGVSAEDLFVAVWDEDAGAWVEVEGAIIDPVTGTVTMQVSHFSKYAVFSRVEPVPVPTVISAPVAEPEEPKPEEPKAEEPKAEEPKVEEPVVEEPVVEEPVVEEPVVEEGVNVGVLVGSIIGGVVVLAAAVYFFWWRRRVY